MTTPAPSTTKPAAPASTPSGPQSSASRWASILRQVGALGAIVAGSLQAVNASTLSGKGLLGAALALGGSLIFYAEHNNNGNTG